MSGARASEAGFLTSALYKFVPIADPAALRQPLRRVCAEHDVRGTLLLATEGINGTIAGPPAGVRAVLAWLRADPRFADLEDKQSWSERAPFQRLKVRLKAEIVALHVPGLRPAEMAGRHVDAADWNALIAAPDVVLVDTRNAYEVAIGTFEGAIDPGTRSFSELPDWVAKQSEPGGLLAERGGRRPRVAMFCTGGIRCEKSTALLRSRGFDEVYHLRGGILKYLETVAPAHSRWQGQCFVFDERVSVGHGLQPGGLDSCRACGWPLSAAGRASPWYRPGLSCDACHALDDAARLRRLQARRRASVPEGDAAAPTPRASGRPGRSARVDPPLIADPVAELCARLRALAPGRRLVIGLAGLPGAGKSTWAAQAVAAVNRRLGEPAAVALGMDGFHLSRARLAARPDAAAALARRGAPWTFDPAALASAVRAIREAGSGGVERRWPGFAHDQGDPVPDAVPVPAAARLVLLEGLYLLHRGDGWALEPLLDACWFLDTPAPQARARLLQRHMAAWGLDAAAARARIEANDARNARIVLRTRQRAQGRVLDLA